MCGHHILVKLNSRYSPNSASMLIWLTKEIETNHQKVLYIYFNHEGTMYNQCVGHADHNDTPKTFNRSYCYYTFAQPTDNVCEIVNVPQNFLKVRMSNSQHVDSSICTQSARLGMNNVSCRQLKLLLGNNHILEECISGVSSSNGSVDCTRERLTCRVAHSMPRTSFYQ